MEILQGRTLYNAVREEIETAYTTDPITGQPALDSQRLASLPLLQSIWTVTLRLRMSFNVTRDVKESIVINGHTIAQGSMIQAPMMISHHDKTWGTIEHPASKFWAQRHIQHDSAGTHFSMAGQKTSFFPFGGGANICPGRQFAKLEVITTVALVLSKFEIEVQAWTTVDGKPSNRPAKSDVRYCGTGAMAPDRDLQVRWKRIATQLAPDSEK